VIKQRNLSVSPWLSVFLVLLLLGLFGFLFIQSNALTDTLKRNVVAVAFFDQATPPEALDQLENNIRDIKGIEKTVLLNSEDILNTYEPDFVADIKSTLGDIQLPASLEIYFHVQTPHKDLLQLLKKIEQMDYVEDVEFENTLHSQISSLSKTGYQVLILGSILILLVSILLIRNSVRLDVFTRRKLVKSMQLVGATEGFILRPFLIKAVLQGTTSAVLAFVVAFFATSGVWVWIMNQANVFSEFKEELISWGNISSFIPQYSILFASMVCVACLITVGTTWVSTKKYLKIRLDDLY
jgi:cell division transport system permease protein